MEAVRAGGDRQELHEKIRVHARAAAEGVKAGESNDLIARIEDDPAFASIHSQLADLLDPVRFVGRAPRQVLEFLEEEVQPAIEPYHDQLGHRAVTRV